eukprot:tig00000383_g24669.t1
MAGRALPPVHEDDEDDRFMMAGAGRSSYNDPTRFSTDSQDFDPSQLRATGTTLRDSRGSEYDSQDSFDMRNPRTSGAYSGYDPRANPRDSAAYSAGYTEGSGDYGAARGSTDSYLYSPGPRYRVEGVNYEESGEYSEGDPRGRISGSVYSNPDPRASLASTDYQRRPIDSQDSFDLRIAAGARTTAPPAGKSGPHGGQRAPLTYSTDDSLEHDEVQLGTMTRGGTAAAAMSAAAARSSFLDDDEDDGMDSADYRKYLERYKAGHFSDSDEEGAAGPLPPKAHHAPAKSPAPAAPAKPPPGPAPAPPRGRRAALPRRHPDRPPGQPAGPEESRPHRLPARRSRPSRRRRGRRGVPERTPAHPAPRPAPAHDRSPGTLLGARPAALELDDGYGSEEFEGEEGYGELPAPADYHDVTQWRPEEVARWVDHVAFPQYAAAFLAKRVDGAMLLGTTMVNLEYDLEVPSAAHRRHLLDCIRALSDEHERGRLSPEVLKAVRPAAAPREEHGEVPDEDLPPDEARRRAKEREAKKKIWERGVRPARRKPLAQDPRDVRLQDKRVLKELDNVPRAGAVKVWQSAKVGDVVTAPAVYVNRAQLLKEQHVRQQLARERKPAARMPTENEILDYFQREVKLEGRGKQRGKLEDFGEVQGPDDPRFDRFLDSLVPNDEGKGGFITHEQAERIRSDHSTLNGVPRKLLALYRLAKAQHFIQTSESKHRIQRAELDEKIKESALNKVTPKECEDWLTANCGLKSFGERDLDEYASATPLNLTPEQRYALKKMRNPRKMFALRAMLMANRAVARMEQDKAERLERRELRKQEPLLRKLTAAEEQAAGLLRARLGAAIGEAGDGDVEEYLRGNALNLEPAHLQELLAMPPGRRIRVTAAIIRGRELYGAGQGAGAGRGKGEAGAYKLVAEREEEFFQRELAWEYPFECMLDAFLEENVLGLAPEHVAEIRAFPHPKKVKALATILRVGAFLGRVEHDHRRRARRRELLEQKHAPPARARSSSRGRSPRPARPSASPGSSEGAQVRGALAGDRVEGCEGRGRQVEEAVKEWLLGPPLRLPAVTEELLDAALEGADFGLAPREVSRLKMLPLAKRARALYDIAHLEERVVEFFKREMGWPRVDTERLDGFLQTFDLGLSGEQVERLRAQRLDKRARAVHDLLKLDSFLKRMQSHSDKRQQRREELEARVAGEEKEKHTFRPLLHRHLLLPLASKLTRQTLQDARTALLEQGRQAKEKRAARRKKKASVEEILFGEIDKENKARQKKEALRARLYGDGAGRGRSRRRESSSGSEGRSRASSGATERFWYSDSDSNDSLASDTTERSARSHRSHRRSHSRHHSRSRSRRRAASPQRGASRGRHESPLGRHRSGSRGRAGRQQEVGHVRRFIHIGFEDDIDYAHIFPPDHAERPGTKHPERDRRGARSRSPGAGRPGRAPPALPSGADLAGADEFYRAQGSDAAGLGPYTSDSRHEQVGAYSEAAAAREARARDALPGTRSSMRGLHEVAHRKEALRVEYPLPRPASRRPSLAGPAVSPRRASVAVPGLGTVPSPSPRGGALSARRASIAASPRYDGASPRPSGGYDPSRYAAPAGPLAASPHGHAPASSPRRLSLGVIPPSPRSVHVVAPSPRGAPSPRRASSSLGTITAASPRHALMTVNESSPAASPRHAAATRPQEVPRPISADSAELLARARERAQAIREKGQALGLGVPRAF